MLMRLSTNFYSETKKQKVSFKSSKAQQNQTFRKKKKPKAKIKIMQIKKYNFILQLLKRKKQKQPKTTHKKIKANLLETGFYFFYMKSSCLFNLLIKLLNSYCFYYVCYLFDVFVTITRS